MNMTAMMTTRVRAEKQRWSEKKTRRKGPCQWTPFITPPSQLLSSSSPSILLVLLVLFISLPALSLAASESSSPSPSSSAPSSSSASSSTGPVRIPLRRHTITPSQHSTRPHLLQHKLASIQHSLTLMEASSRSWRWNPLRTLRHATQSFASDRLTIPLTNFFNRMYTGPVSIGTPPDGQPQQSYNLVFDTGSADLWVFSSKSQETEPPAPWVTYYNASQSTSSKTTEKSWEIQYGKGSASGVLVHDVVRLGGLQADDVIFAEALTYKDLMQEDLPLDGLLGLAFQKANSQKLPTLMDALKANGLIPHRIFSFYMSTEYPDGSLSGPSEFVLGAPDLNLTRDGSLTYLDLPTSTEPSMWLLSMQQVKLDESDPGYCTSSAPCIVLPDTGTSFIGMPPDAFIDLVKRIQRVRKDCYYDTDNGLVVCQQNRLDGLPTLSFSIQGSAFTLSPSFYFLDAGGGDWMLGLMAIDVGSKQPLWILGDTFLRAYYTVFDMDNKRVGMTGAKPGVPYNPDEIDWATILIATGLSLLGVGLCIFAGIRYLHRRRASRSRADSNGNGNGNGALMPGAGHRLGGRSDNPSPYVLQPAPPFRAAAYTAQQPYPAAPVVGGAAAVPYAIPLQVQPSSRPTQPPTQPPPTSSQPWNCLACTYLNNPPSIMCEMCGTQRGPQ